MKKLGLLLFGGLCVLAAPSVVRADGFAPPLPPYGKKLKGCPPPCGQCPQHCGAPHAVHYPHAQYGKGCGGPYVHTTCAEPYPYPPPRAKVYHGHHSHYDHYGPGCGKGLPHAYGRPYPHQHYPKVSYDQYWAYQGPWYYGRGYRQVHLDY